MYLAHSARCALIDGRGPECDCIDGKVVERAAVALNDEWAVHPLHGAFWPQLEEPEREKWREAVRLVFAAAFNDRPSASPAPMGEEGRDPT